MADILAELTEKTVSKMRKLGINSLSPPVIRALLDIAYFASMRTEESHFVRGCLTFADPKSPETDPPLLRRADYPGFAPFRRRRRLTVEALAKLSRAIDQWSGALAVFGTKPTDLFVWGVIDQRVHENIRVHRERPGGFTNPGILTISMEGAGALSVTHEGLFLCALRQDKIVTRESEALTSHLLRVNK
jgi:hypothetical protein